MLARESTVELVVLCARSQSLHNPYSAITVRADRVSAETFRTAQQFLKYLTSAETRRRIAGYQKNGRPFFVPATETE